MPSRLAEAAQGIARICKQIAVVPLDIAHSFQAMASTHREMPATMLVVRQKLPDPQVEDIAATTRHEMEDRKLAEGFAPGARIALAVGSRGISNLPIIVRSVVDYWKDKGLSPFIVPAMGSHGGATAGGQKDVLAHRGITEASMGCPIESAMDVVSLGLTAKGTEAFMDRQAYQSDGVFLINRVNRHTDFEGPIESGLCKMATIGLGNETGAKNYHRIAYSGVADLDEVLPDAAHHIFSTGKIIGGLAIVENAHNSTVKLMALPVAEIEKTEPELLVLAKSLKARIPVRELDLLIVDEIGKNISGPGMDPKVVNRSSTTGAYNPIKVNVFDPIKLNAPWIGRIYVRSLHPDSGHNAMGIGMADVINDRVIRDMDEKITRTNAAAAQIPKVADVPTHYGSDRHCLTEAIGLTADPANPRIGWILNSKELSVMALSPNLRKEIEANPSLEIVGEIAPLRFDWKGQLKVPLKKLLPA